jgi:hypothetical protein
MKCDMSCQSRAAKISHERHQRLNNNGVRSITVLTINIVRNFDANVRGFASRQRDLECLQILSYIAKFIGIGMFALANPAFAYHEIAGTIDRIHRK